MLKSVFKNMPELSIGDLTAKIPIIQGGMGVGVSLSSLASAVGNAGGIGVISAAGMGFNKPDYKENPAKASINALKDEIRKAKAVSKGIIGVNIMVAMSNFSDMVKTSLEEGIDIIFAGAGLPLNLPEYLLAGMKTKLVPIISSPRAASLILKKWTSKFNYLPDAFVVEGPMAGGHLGFKREQLSDNEYALEHLIPQVLGEVKAYEEEYNRKIPVIAAGGIFTGQDISRFINLGASGVQMGTRFVTTNECDVSIEFKKAYIDCREEDVVIIDSPVGLPGRAIKNEFIQAVEKREKQPFNCPYQCIKTCDYKESLYCIALALINAMKGNFKSGFAFAGQNAYRLKAIISVNDLMETLKNEYSAALGNT